MLTKTFVDDVVLLYTTTPGTVCLADPVLRSDRDEVGIALELDLGAHVVIPLPQKRLCPVLRRADVLARYSCTGQTKKVKG